MKELYKQQAGTLLHWLPAAFTPPLTVSVWHELGRWARPALPTPDLPGPCHCLAAGLHHRTSAAQHRKGWPRWAGPPAVLFLLGQQLCSQSAVTGWWAPVAGARSAVPWRRPTERVEEVEMREWVCVKYEEETLSRSVGVTSRSSELILPAAKSWDKYKLISRP